MMSRIQAAATAIALIAPAVTQADTLATCTAPSGKSYYMDEGRWSDDAISKGRFVFTVDGKGNPNLLFEDVRGTTVDAAADGATIMFSFVDVEQRSFGIVIAYSTTGVTEAYNVVTQPDGSRSMLWTSNRPGLTGSGKVTAMVGKCT